MDKKIIQSMLQEVRQNNAKRMSCKRHRFVINGKLAQRVTCTNCGCIVDVARAMYYRDGYVAHGGDPNDVMVIENG